MPTPHECSARLIGIANDNANRAKIIEKKCSVMSIGISLLDANPFVLAGLGPSPVETAGSVNSPLPSFASHAFEGNITPPFRRQDNQNVADNTIAPDAKGCSVDEETVA